MELHIVSALILGAVVYVLVRRPCISINTISTSNRTFLYTILFLGIEKPYLAFGGPALFGLYLFLYENVQTATIILVSLMWPIALASTSLCLIFFSQSYGEANEGDKDQISKRQDELFTWNHAGFKKKWRGHKIPIEIANEAFQDQIIDYKCVLTTYRSRHDIFKFTFTVSHLRSLIVDMLYRLWKHDSDADKADVSDVYNRGNDFYGWFLDERMLYSMGHFEDSEETDLPAKCERAQTHKLHKICKNILDLKPGDEHLDFGCGWGALVNMASREYGAKSTGITLSQEQANHIEKLGDNPNLEIKVMNAWNVPDDKKYDKITCVEMSEHIGIRDYQKFLHKVRGLLKDDGIFYLQIAGLRRGWQYEDMIWGLFMNKYVFPGADASLSLSWDIEQLDRAGFEVHTVENCGTHYGMTILTWYHNWVKNRKKVVDKYGEKSWRTWSLFLAWSHMIAMQGSSTVYMISMTKNFPYDKRSRYPSLHNGDEPAIDRAKLFIDNDRSMESRKLG